MPPARRGAQSALLFPEYVIYKTKYSCDIMRYMFYKKSKILEAHEILLPKTLCMYGNPRVHHIDETPIMLIKRCEYISGFFLIFCFSCFVAGAVLCGPCKAHFVAGAGLCGPWSAEFVAGAGLFVGLEVQISWQV